MKRRILTILTALLAMIAIFAFATACTTPETPPPEPGVTGAEGGEYYCDLNGEEHLVNLQEETKFTLTIAGETFSGIYTLDGESLVLKVTDGETYFANYRDEILTLNIGGMAYKFIRKITYTVTFEVNGGSSVSEAKVVNGKTLAKPADPTKEGSIFVGWYADNAFKTIYSFARPVTENTTLYARFVEPIDPEFTVNFDLGYTGAEEIPARQTTGGKLFNLPVPERAGYNFLGWWVSHYDDSTKLSYQYKDQAIEEHITLHAVWRGNAPAVSVENSGVTWTSTGVNNTYNVKITAPDGTTEERSVGSTSLDYDFTSKAAGDYIIEVTSNGNTGKAYFRNKGLARVCVFEVEDSLLKFNAVSLATKYLLTIDCGTPEHTHTATPIDLEDKTVYDFSNCDMKKDGIVFTVIARADGYVDSVSEAFTFERTLDEAVVTVNKNDETVTWNEVANATSYNVSVEIGGQQVYSAENVTTRVLSMKYYNKCEITIRVTPVAKGWNSPETTEFVYQKATLAVPQNLRLRGSTLSWDAIEGATGYEVKLGDQTYTVSVNEISLDGKYTAGNTIVASVRATTSNAVETSLYSEEITLRSGEMGEIGYNAGNVTWSPVFGASEYVLKLNEEDEIKVADNTCAITLTRAVNSIVVYAVFADGSQSEKVILTVDAFKITFDARGGEEIPAQYKVTGDPITLPKTEQLGFTFAGWYTAPGGAHGTGTRYDKSIFDGTENLTLFAAWESLPFKIYLDASDFSDEKFEPISVYYDQHYTLPVVTSVNDPMKAFGGWYTDRFGAGMQYATFEGKSVRVFDGLSDITLYARCVDIFEFKSIQNGYSVSKGPGIDFVKEITIPQTYNNLPVTTVENFSYLSNLTCVNIYDTIQLISMGGVSSTAFRGCDNLLNINILPCQGDVCSGDHDIFYESIDGVLMRFNTVTGHKELRYFPIAKSGSYTIPDSVTMLPSSAFYGAKNVTEIYVPASVTMVEQQAFYSVSSLTKVAFLAAEEGQEEAPLTLRLQAFYLCSKLTEITLPGRINDFATGSIVSCNSLQNVFLSGNNDRFASVDGLFCKILESGSKELIFYPAGRTGDFLVPSGIRSIGDQALKGNTKVSGVTFPFYVTNIGKEAFSNCTGIKFISFGGTAGDLGLTIGNSAFYGCTNTAFTTVTLPANLEKLGVNAFGNCTRLIEVRVESAYEGFSENDAFADTTAARKTYVKTVYLGEKVAEMNISGVFGITLQDVIVDPNNANYTSIDGVLYNKTVTAISYYPMSKEGHYDMPDTITVIGANAFNSRAGLTSINIGAKVAMIEDYAFNNCVNLASVTFAKDGTEPLTLKTYVFYGCTSLTVVELPDRTNAIGASAFYNCSNLKTINIPNAVTSLGDFETKVMDVFLGCDSLEDIIVEDGSQNFASIGGVLYAKTNGVVTDLCYCPINKGGVVEVPNTVKMIWGNAFYLNKLVTEIKFSGELAQVPDPENPNQMIPGTLEIASRAFYECSSLLKVALPNGLCSISTETFFNCSALLEIVIPNTVWTIDSSAFTGCSKLSKVEFVTGNTDNTLTIGGSVFSGCISLIEITLPERTTVINAGAFVGSGLEIIHLPASLGQIGDSAFANLALKEVTFAENSTLYSIGNSAFSHTTLTSINLPDSVREIGTRAFEYTSLTSIKMPRSLTKISDYAFYYTRELTEVIFNEGLDRIEQYAFAGGSLKEAHFPASLTFIGMSAFNTNGTLETIVFADNSLMDEIRGQNTFTSKVLTKVDFGKNSKLRIIGNAVFTGCIGLTSIELPASLETITMRAFEYCYNLESVTFEKGDFGNGKTSRLKEIGARAFDGNALKAFEFPESTNDIILGETVFTRCRLLTKLHVSTSLKAFGSGLRAAGSIKVVTVAEGHPTFGEVKDGILFSNDGNAIRMIFGELKDAFIIEDGMREVGEDAFYRQTSIKYVYIPASVEALGYNAFGECISLETVEIEEGSRLHTLAGGCFAGCVKLKNINLEVTTRLETLDRQPTGSYSKATKSAFTDCSSLISVDLSRNPGLKELPSYLFDNCSSLVSVKLPPNLEKFEGSCFSKCTSLESVDFSGNTTLTTLPASFFSGATSLKSISLPTTLTTLGNNLFKGTALESIDLPAGLTYLGTSTFEDCTSLKRVDLSKLKDLTCFGTSATACTISSSSKLFKGCTSLEEVVLPSNLKSIGAEVFYNCTSLTTINLENVTLIGNSAFRNTGFTNIPFDLKTGVTYGSYILAECKNLENVVLSKESNIVTLPSYLFQNCSNLASFDFNGNKTITSLGMYLFNGCSQLKTIELPNQVSYIGTHTFRNSGLEYIDLRNTKITRFSTGATTNVTTSTSSYVFADCSNLETVILPENFTQIGGYAFQNCTKLTEFDFSKITHLSIRSFDNTGIKEAILNKNLSVMGTYTFANCANLQTVSFSGNTTLTTLYSYTFQNCISLENVDVPSSITYVGTYAFQNSGIKSIDLSKTKITQLGSSATGTVSISTAVYAFDGCTNLETITLPSIKAIGAYTFRNCTSLKNINIENVTLIGNYAFENTALESITLNNLVSLGNYAFQGSSLKSFYIPDSLTTLGTAPFADCTDLAVITVDPGNTFFSTDPNGFLLDSNGALAMIPAGFEALDGVLTLSDALTGINSYAFCGVQRINEVVLPDSIETIGNYAFYGSEIKKITIPASVKTIGNYAFTGSSFESITIPATVASIGNYAFANSFIKEVTILNPDSVATATYLFDGATGLTKVNLPEGLTTIGDYWFRGTTALESIKIPSSVTTIKTYAFSASGLRTLTIPATVTTIGNYAFNNNLTLTEINILANALNGTYLFDGCKNLSKVTFADDITAIGNFAFRDSYALESVTLPKNIQTIGTNVFNGSGLKRIELPEGLLTTGANAFSNSKLEHLVFPSTMTSIGALTDIPTLKSVKLPDKITAFPSFKGCVSLEALKVPSGVSSILGGYLENCTSIKHFFMPSNVSSFVGNTFNGWTEDQTVYMESSLFEFCGSLGSYTSAGSLFKTFNAKLITGVSYEEYLKLSGNEF